MAVVLEITKATKSYKRGAPVLRDIKLKVEAGELVALIGASGSGKSTLIRLISGMEQMDAGAGGDHSAWPGVPKGWAPPAGATRSAMPGRRRISTVQSGWPPVPIAKCSDWPTWTRKLGARNAWLVFQGRQSPGASQFRAGRHG